MKIIDLLNKIANGQEVPYKIRIKDREYFYDKYSNWYFFGKTSEDMFIDKGRLNDEVEILEEEKKIPEKLSTWFSVETKQSKELNIEYANTNFENMYEKINEIIDYLKNKGE